MTLYLHLLCDALGKIIIIKTIKINYKKVNINQMSFLFYSDIKIRHHIKGEIPQRANVISSKKKTTKANPRLLN